MTETSAELAARVEQVRAAGQAEADRLRAEAASVLAATEEEMRRLQALAAAQRAVEDQERQAARIQSEIDSIEGQTAAIDEAIRGAEVAAREAQRRHRELSHQAARLVGGPVTNAEHEIRTRLGREATQAATAAMEARDRVLDLQRQSDALEARVADLRAKLDAPPAPVPTAPSVAQDLWTGGRDPRPEATRGWFGLLGRRIGS